MSSIKEKLVNSMQNASYYNASPEELAHLHTESNKYLATNQLSLAEDELFGMLEQHFYLSLLTCHDSEAKLVLQRITDRVTQNPSRVAILQAQYIEATEGPEAAQKFLTTRPPGDLKAFKRRTVILKQKGDIKAYIKELLRYLEEVSPHDTETWVELAEAYVSIGYYPQAIHSLEEVLILAPQAYNIFARLGEILLIDAATSPSSKNNDNLSLLIQSAQHFLRSIELSPDYVRGWCGVLISTCKILSGPKLSQEDKAKYYKINDDIAQAQIRRIIKAAKELSIPDEDISAAKLISQEVSTALWKDKPKVH